MKAQHWIHKLTFDLLKLLIVSNTISHLNKFSCTAVTFSLAAECHNDRQRKESTAGFLYLQLDRVALAYPITRASLPFQPLHNFPIVFFYCLNLPPTLLVWVLWKCFPGKAQRKWGGEASPFRELASWTWFIAAQRHYQTSMWIRAAEMEGGRGRREGWGCE